MNSKYVLFLLMTLASLQACTKLLNQTPTTSLASTLAYADSSRILELVNGLYTDLKSGSFYGGGYLLDMDVRGEDYLNRTQNTNSGYLAWSENENSTSTEVGGVWSAAYTTINAVNTFIAGLQQNPGVISDSLTRNFIAEALFLRAVSYFSLVTIYATPYNENNGTSPGLPLRLKSESGPTDNSLAPSSVAAIYAQIISDLDSAEANLPLQYSSALLNTTRAHRNTAIAFKTRVYLTIGNYAGAIQEAAKIVSPTAPYKALTGVPNQLQSNATVPFLGNDYTTTESVFSMPMTALNSSTIYSALGYDYQPAPNGDGDYSLNPKGIAGDTGWHTTDARRQFITTVGTTPYLQKYYSQGSPYLNYVPVVRYAETLLNYAEALANVDSLAKAASLLTFVRQRADPTYVFNPDSLSNQSSLIDAILHERRIELLGEGFRSNDLLRTLSTIPAKSTVNAVPPTSQQYFWPLPSTETSTNQAL
jgi:starch-binding outer membrane protein, SusD/RagB family